jgi:hypothetical protein
MTRVSASYWYVIINLGVLAGSVVTYLQYRSLTAAGLAGLLGAATANGIVALWHRRRSRTEGPSESAPQTAQADVARPVHWSKKVGVALAAVGLANLLLAIWSRDTANLAFGAIFAIQGVFLALRRTQ